MVLAEINTTLRSTLCCYYYSSLFTTSGRYTKHANETKI